MIQQTSSISMCILNTFAGSLLDRVNTPLCTLRHRWRNLDPFDSNSAVRHRLHHVTLQGYASYCRDGSAGCDTQKQRNRMKVDDDWSLLLKHVTVVQTWRTSHTSVSPQFLLSRTVCIWSGRM